LGDFIYNINLESACLPRGIIRACSLSLILFPQASALSKTTKKQLLPNI
jgi:hypothetical protein